MKKTINTYLGTLASCLCVLATNSHALGNDNDSIDNLPSTALQWQAVVKQDIHYAYQQSATNHPGMLDSHNPGFAQLLENARQQALVLVEKVKDASGYEATIARFNTVLQDGHAGAVAVLPKSVRQPRRWPGFSVVWRGDGLKVYYSEHDKVTKGDKVISCNDTPIKPLMRNTLFKFHGQVEQPGHWWNQGWRLLIDDGNPFLPPLKTCNFVQSSGVAYSLQLQWVERPDSVNQHLVNAYNGDKLEVGLHWPVEDIAWIAMPTFAPNETEKSNYQQLFADLARQREQLLTATAVVLDLRHNQGGSSFWSLKIAEQLWGQQIVNYRKDKHDEKTQVWWRASKDNTQYVESLVTVLRDQPEMHEMVKAMSAGMRASLEAGKAFYVEHKPQAKNASKQLAESDFRNKAIVIVPGQCGSACLDAIDTFKLFSNTVLFGAPSSSDSTYMEVRLVDTPSGLSKIIIPNKVYVDRARGNGDFYQPDIPFNEVEWTTEALLEGIKKVAGSEGVSE